jgi:hypothetical protein
LLEEERDSCLARPIADIADPRGIHRPMVRPGLAADDDPVDAQQIEPIERP